MSRYLTILRVFWSTSLAAEMEYRAQFVVATLSSALALGGSLFTLMLLYRVGYQPGGWTWDQALLLMGLFEMLEGFSNTVLSPNLSRIVQHVQQGTLDFVLLKPVDSQFWLSFRNCSPWGLPNVVLGIGILIYAGTKLHLHVATWALGLVPVAFGLLVLYSLWFVIGATSVWFVKVFNATEVLRTMIEVGRYPINAQSFPTFHRLLFTFVIPVVFLTTVPAEAMMGRAGWTWLVAAGLLAAGLFVFSRVFWRFALRYYTSASS